jgi:flagellin-like protein
MILSRRTGKAAASKGVSPIIATLLLIVITVAAAVVAYGFVTGFIGGVQAPPVNTGISVDSVSPSPSSIILYIRNTGNTPIIVATCYVQGASSLAMIPITPTISVSPGGVGALTIANNFSDGQYQFRIVSTSGAQCIASSYISGGNGSSGSDSTPPTCSSVGTNTTIAGDQCLFSSSWSDNVGLSGSIFSTNVTGSWVNSSWIAFAGNIASAVMTLPPSAGIVLGFGFYANDTSNNWSTSGITYITTTTSTFPLSVNCTAIYQSSSRVNNGSAVSLSYCLLWSSNSSAVASGTLSINGTGYPILGGWCNFTVSSSSVTRNTYAETSVNSGGCTLYNQLPSNPSVIWDRLNIAYASNGTSLKAGQTAQITITATYEYDNSPASLVVNTLRNGTHYATDNFFDSESGATVYTYSLENFTDTVNGITVYDSSPLTVKWTIAPAGVVAYFPITLSNNQATATAANFQQQLFINWSLCIPYVNSSLSNIIFFDNSGNRLYAWDENGTTNASDSLTTVWVNLDSNTIPANSDITINIGFFPLNYDNRGQTSYWGIFPTATSTYAQYDNGYKVFIFYDNFNGTSISSAWNTAGAAGTYSVNNGLTMNSYWFPGYSFTLNNQYTGPMIVDAYEVATSGCWIGVSFSDLQTTSSSYTLTSGAVQWVYPPQGADGINGLCTASGSTAFTPDPPSTTLQVVTLAVNSTTATEYQNYVNPATVSGTISLMNYPGLGQVAWNPSDIQTTYWFRLRAYAPNNVMPSALFGGLIVP